MNGAVVGGEWTGLGSPEEAIGQAAVEGSVPMALMGLEKAVAGTCEAFAQLRQRLHPALRELHPLPPDGSVSAETRCPSTCPLSDAVNQQISTLRALTVDITTAQSLLEL